MSDGGRPPASEPDRAETPADEEYAEAYAQGYGEGLREALREVLQHASRGHTAQELRWLIESRLARLAEDVEVKRRSVLAPPRRPAWGPLLRPPQPPTPWRAGREAAPPVAPVAGGSFLFQEDRPRRGIEFVARAAARFPGLLVISLYPPAFPGVDPGRASVVRLSPSGPGAAGGLSPSEIAGKVREAVERPGGALVYLDALEFLLTEFGVELTLKFVNYCATQVREHASAFVLSTDPRSLDPRDASRLQRAFNNAL